MKVTPTQLFPSYVFDGNNITISLADLVGLDAAEADAAAGNGASVVLALVDKIASALAALPQKPTKMTATKGSIAGIGPNRIRQPYNFTFEAEFDQGSVNVVSE